MEGAYLMFVQDLSIFSLHQPFLFVRVIINEYHPNHYFETFNLEA
jgi:hypothetical protein